VGGVVMDGGVSRWRGPVAPVVGLLALVRAKVRVRDRRGSWLG
jgi:hypothetical protein